MSLTSNFLTEYLQFFSYVRLSKGNPVLQKRFKECFSTLFSTESFSNAEVVKVYWRDDTREK